LYSWRINVLQKRDVMKFRTYSLHSENGPPLRQSHSFILSVVSSARQPNPYAFLAVRMLQSITWWLKDITMLPGSSSKPWTKAIGNIIFTNIGSETRMAQQKPGLAGTCSQQDFTPMASTNSFSRRILILLKARCYLHTTSWNEKWPSKRHTGCTPFALGWTPHWSKIFWWYTTRATTSKSNWTA